jgi:hypothetical protein
VPRDDRSDRASQLRRDLPVFETERHERGLPAGFGDGDRSCEAQLAVAVGSGEDDLDRVRRCARLGEEE